MQSTPVSAAALIIACALALPSAMRAGSQPGESAAPGPTEAFFPSPNRVEAGQSFALRILSYRYNCGTEFSHASFTRDGDALDFRFVARENPAAVCPAVIAPFGPSFDMPALPEGRYHLTATALQPCLVAPQPCEIAEKREDAGVLTVGRPDSGWYVSPATVPANRDFTLRILSDRYGSCQTSFSHQNLVVQDGKMVATFVIETDLQRVCIHDVRPHGPAFQVQALEPGKYPVHVIEAPACAYRQPICPWLPPELTAVLVDTLVVTSGTSLGAHPHPGARANGGRAPLSHLSRGILHVSRPGDASADGAARPHDAAGRRLPARPIPVPK
jgi:hypothetical protein